jgi:hypothetical protein
LIVLTVHAMAVLRTHNYPAKASGCSQEDASFLLWDRAPHKNSAGYYPACRSSFMGKNSRIVITQKEEEGRKYIFPQWATCDQFVFLCVKFIF